MEAFDVLGDPVRRRILGLDQQPVFPPAILRPTGDGRAEVELLDPEEGVSPGQACVFYATEGTRVLGGGWIAHRRAA